ncbi:hypothetical protein EG68_01238 [Paragonimus skrjabini miyazakii]|uniref:Uncharacterized protein n=1 Tax=Paragonimus skrjabini miyazakii TaxID=59628 RepID=A0A8S9Z665_9TREM|nr:hypothetical protein EG68_01238 [Paragonimus skrjabini miyazakii]
MLVPYTYCEATYTYPTLYWYGRTSVKLCQWEKTSCGITDPVVFLIIVTNSHPSQSFWAELITVHLNSSR